MEVVAATHTSPGSNSSPGGPFQRHDVQEWQRLNRLTGALETARRESGCWKNEQQQYGKVVDSCSLVSADGSAAQRQLRQLEVFQSRSPGASLQVIRAHTHTSSSSSSRWSQRTAGAIAGTAAGDEFENLQLSLNPLDLSSQKTKASVGRSGSIGGRRPPSRPRSLTSDLEVTARLQKVSRLCQQLHEEAVTTATNLHDDLTKRTSSGEDTVRSFDFKKFEERPSILERQNGDGSVASGHFERISPEIEDWRSSFGKKSSDLDTDRRLNTALRGNNVDLEALDQILKSISSSTSSNYSDKISLSDDLLKEEPENPTNIKKRHSFITAESLQEVRGRLRRLSSPIDKFHQKIEAAKEVEPDDGISEDTSMMKKEDTMPASNNGVSRVRSYVYGMEAMLHNKKPIIDTGSLESRTSNKSNGSSINRSEDWYNRRKSYGFEQVHNQQINNSNLRGKNKIESSTDSGICRSTEIVVIPTVFKEENNKFNKVTSYSKIGSTVINLSGDTNKPTSNEYTNNTKDNELFSVWNRRSIVTQEDPSKKEQITITIPIVSEETTNQNGRRTYHRQISDGTSVSVESPWTNNTQNSPEVKRHSIAVDESKYIDNKYTYPQLRRTSLAVESKPEEKSTLFDLQDEENSNILGKKQKKVEFCKTEVHFAAESGRVNIVETDEKPPPTQNFRRRRRNSSITNNVSDEFNKNGLPVTHFGDTSYEKKLFGDSETPQNNLTETFNKDLKYSNNPQLDTVLCNNVTVSAVSVNNTNKDYEERETYENENPPRGILKNRMIKPRPYILGDDKNELFSSNNEEESTIWGVRLRPVHKEEPPQIWRSTVTVQNTSYNPPDNSSFKETPKPEFQKFLHSLRPTRKSEPTATSPENPTERYSPILDNRRSSWSVADRVKQVEDMKQTEIKGYSTRVNFGSGEATVVENGDLKNEDRSPTWPREETQKDEIRSSSVIQKGLVVRIGREDSNHTVCSKTTTNHNSQSTTTTTKITIDMSPSPTTSLDKIEKFPVPIKLPRASLHSLKSTSLIMNTFAKDPPPIIPTNRNPPEAIPDQLAALKKLYEDAEHSDDSLADEEVRSYMSAHESEVRDSEDEVSSVVSGSWSKLKAFRNINQHLNSLKEDQARQKEAKMFSNIINRSTYSRKDFQSSKSSLQPQTPDSLISSRFDKSISSEAKVTSIRQSERRSSNNSSLDSPQLERKQIKKYDLPRYTNGHLSSPFLVGSSIQKNNSQKKIESVIEQSKEERSAFNKVVNSKDSPSLRKKNITRKTFSNNQTYSKNNNNISSPTKKLTDKPRNHTNQWKENKPDLLQFSDNREYANLTTVIQEKKSPTTKKVSSLNKDRPESPIYENIDEVINNLQQMEKESTMLQELTKAADQILQAVNGYTDEDLKLSTDSEDESRKHRINFRKTSENLSTISETKSWKQQTQTKVSVKNPKTKVRPTSSTSSIESITKESKPVPPVRMNRATKLNEAKKKITSSNSELSKATRARRLQRASSREALLQSHGSSSEDIASNMEIIRKPRLVRRSKTQSQSEEVNKKTMSLSSVSRRTLSDVRKSVERVPGLQEIRHKTAVSTIKSTAEKNASREKALKAKEDLKKRTVVKSSSSCKGLAGSSSYSRPSSRDPGVSVSARSSSLTTKKYSKGEGSTKY